MNNITVLLCSHRTGGTSHKILELLKRFTELKLDLVTFDKLKFESCVHCFKCGTKGQCVGFIKDDFNALLEKIKVSEAVIIISPLYALIPSKMTAFLERLVSVTYFTEQNGKCEIPLKDKKVGVICYDSSGRNTELEGIIRKILRPNLTGYLSDSQAEDLFFEDAKIEYNDNIIAYIQNYFIENFYDKFNIC